MLWDKADFLQKFEQKKLQIAFIGMSNIGKSYRTQQLKKKFGFEAFSVDDGIGEELGFTTMHEMSVWMGYPFRERYKKAEKEYLSIEDRQTQHRFSSGKNCILDTTGSVIYLPKKTLQQLKDKYLIIHLSCPNELIDYMITDFFAELKPVIWNAMYSCKKGEDEKEALKRCYPKLLEDRRVRYSELGDITLSGNIARDENITVSDFWKMIVDSLPQK
jgi:shikimate kinase